MATFGKVALFFLAYIIVELVSVDVLATTVTFGVVIF